MRATERLALIAVAAGAQTSEQAAEMLGLSSDATMDRAIKNLIREGRIGVEEGVLKVNDQTSPLTVYIYNNIVFSYSEKDKRKKLESPPISPPFSLTSPDDFVLPEEVDSRLWEAFKKLRKQLRRPMVDAKAQEYMAKKLIKKAKEFGESPNATLSRTLGHGWQSFFPDREKGSTTDEPPKALGVDSRGRPIRRPKDQYEEDRWLAEDLRLLGIDMSPIEVRRLPDDQISSIMAKVSSFRKGCIDGVSEGNRPPD